ncbi:Phosphatidate cytidylyltransferase, mitochondrial [Cytospora mali]|uniref:Phosphatidate cytidylyltransferase, mitochondrial n=1 Tax=Cytospora mali TaxID=578113 RepID=A0A194UW03_CYTMA|nr:Phosphatidate cytidylyltransferase, mitochondrial [Valsa mali var. pyri (nom. inval.)]
MASLRLLMRSTPVRTVLPPTALEHSYRRLPAIPAAHRSFNASSYLRSAGDKGKEQARSALDALEEGSKDEADNANKTSSSSQVHKSSGSGSSANSDLNQANDDWETNPNWNITNFKELPHKNFGVNQHIIINAEFKEALRQIPWQFRAPIRYCFAYGSGVFPQSKPDGRTASAEEIARVHPKAPPAVLKAQGSAPKMIDFIFGVTFTQHWHSLNLNQHRDHYSALGSLGSGAVSYVQDKMGAGVYFNTHIVVNGVLIKYGVVNFDTLSRDLTEWDTLYLAGRLHKPVKILRDDARVRLANQMNLFSALRTALLLLPDRFTEMELYSTIAGISYLGDPRMTLPTENPQKVNNIVGNNLPNFRRLYTPLIETLPNVEFDDPRCTQPHWELEAGANMTLRQDMDPIKRGNMVRRLPKAFRSKLYFQYQRKFAIPELEFKEMMAGDSSFTSSISKRRTGGYGLKFETRIAEDDPAELRSQVRHVIKQTISWPSTTQSMKGLLTGGLKKSFGYVWEKVEKYRDGQKKAAVKETEGGDKTKDATDEESTPEKENKEKKE